MHEVTQTNQANFMRYYNVSRLYMYAPYEENCIVNPGPTIAQGCKMCGFSFMEDWARSYVESLLTFIRARETRLRDDSELPAVIVCNYGNLKVTSFMLFISRCKAGLLGKFYPNNIEPHDILGRLASWKDYDERRTREILMKRYYQEL